MHNGICDEGYNRLAAAVVRKAVEDYESALKKIRRRPDDINANKIIIDCEKFFQNEISIYSDLDGESIMRAIKERVNAEV